MLALTAAGPERAGNIAQLIDAGVAAAVHPAGRSEAVRRRQVRGAEIRLGYKDDYQLRIGDLEAEAEYVGRGRTGTDSVVYFRDLRTVAVGELYTHGTPQPD